MKTRSRLKSELASAAGVSMPTFRKWLLTDKDELTRMGLGPKDKILPPRAVIYLCDKYAIDLDE